MADENLDISQSMEKGVKKSVPLHLPLFSDCYSQLPVRGPSSFVCPPTLNLTIKSVVFILLKNEENIREVAWALKCSLLATYHALQVAK